MNKNIFNLWNKEKQKIHNKCIINVYINQREIWFTKMGQNIGFEENGKKDFSRPVLVLSKVGNLFFTVALTTKGKKNNHFYHRFKNINLFDKHKNNNDNSWAILPQVKVMDKKRFEEKIGFVTKNELDIIKKRLQHCCCNLFSLHFWRNPEGRL